MSQGMFSVGGIASGLDTQGMIEQLLHLERAPVQRLEQQQHAFKETDDAWGQVNTKLSGLREALGAVDRPDAFDRMVAVDSSDPDVVAAEPTGQPGTGSLTFTVDQLAAGHQAAGDVFADPDEPLGAGTFAIASDGTQHTVETGEDTTLAELAGAIEELEPEVSAAVVRVGDDAHRLVLSSEATGEASAFEATSDLDGLEALTVTQQAQDAVMHVGAMEVRRSDNTFDDLVDGVVITLQAPSTQPVTVSARRDVDAAVEGVQGYVSAINEVVDTIGALSDYDVESNTGGPLSGDSTARRIVDSLRSAVVSGGQAWQAGISLDRYGGVNLDEAKLRAAFTEDFDATAGLFADAGGQSDQVLSTTAMTQPGTYEVAVTAPASAPEVVGEDHRTRATTLTITATGSDPVVVDLAQGVDLTTAIAAVNDALAEAGATTVEASEAGGTMALIDGRHGSAFELELHDSGNRFGAGGPNSPFSASAVGADVEGTIGGDPAAGSGWHLAATDGPAMGLTVDATGGGAFSVTYQGAGGLATLVSDTLARHEGSGGSIARARQSISGQIDLYQGRIDAFEDRIAQREITLRQQFVAMESALAQLNSQGAWLNQQLAGLEGGGGGAPA